MSKDFRGASGQQQLV